MYLLQKSFNNDLFMVQEVQPEDVETWLENRVSLFASETHAAYAQTLLGTMQAPSWTPDFRKYGTILSPDFPYFCAKNVREFNDAWLRIMATEVRLRIMQKINFVEEIHFSISDIMNPPPAPWLCLVDRESQKVLVVDRTGMALGGSEKNLVTAVKHKFRFTRDLLASSGKHLEMIEVHLGSIS